MGGVREIHVRRRGRRDRRVLASVGALACVVIAAGCRSSAQPGPVPERSIDPRVDSISPIAPPSALRPPLRAGTGGPLPPPTPEGRPGAPPDAAMRTVLETMATMHVAPIESLPPAAARGQPTPRDAVRKILMARGQQLPPADQDYLEIDASDRMIPGPGGQMAIRVYTPAGGDGPFPVIVYYHGGGWVLANRNIYDGGARGLARAANAVVVSVEYRLAPEHRFPAAHDDALAAYRWVVANPGPLRGDGRRFALAGESAGGNLAVATAMAARDAGVTAPMHVVSVYPIAQPDTTTASYTENAFAKPLSRGMMSWFFGYYLVDQSKRRDPRIDLVHANLRGLPPVTIVNAQIDPLRDDGAMLEQALRTAGVPVMRRTWDGVTHEFFGIAAVHPKAAEAQTWAGERLKEAFGR